MHEFEKRTCNVRVFKLQKSAAPVILDADFSERSAEPAVEG